MTEKEQLFEERYQACDKYIDLKLDDETSKKEREKQRVIYVNKAREVNSKYSEQEYIEWMLGKFDRVH